MTDFNMRSYNATLTFQSNTGSNTARVRVSKTTYSFGVNSTESHSRINRAFYPHKRALGEFTITVDCIGYQEYRNFMNWLRLYAENLFAGQMGNQKGATIMDVYMASRNFHKVGILTTGIDDHDHVGSMTFSPVLTFMMLKDFSDPGTAIVSTSSVSTFVNPQVQNVQTAGMKKNVVVSINDSSGTAAFYPVTVSSYKDMDSSIYNIVDAAVIPGPSYGPDASNPGTHGDQGINSGIPIPMVPPSSAGAS